MQGNSNKAVNKRKTLAFAVSNFSQGYGFSSGHVWMRELDCEEG